MLDDDTLACSAAMAQKARASHASSRLDLQAARAYTSRAAMGLSDLNLAGYSCVTRNHWQEFRVTRTHARSESERGIAGTQFAR